MSDRLPALRHAALRAAATRDPELWSNTLRRMTPAEARQLRADADALSNALGDWLANYPLQIEEGRDE